MCLSRHSYNYRREGTPRLPRVLGHVCSGWGHVASSIRAPRPYIPQFRRFGLVCGWLELSRIYFFRSSSFPFTLRTRARADALAYPFLLGLLRLFRTLHPPVSIGALEVLCGDFAGPTRSVGKAALRNFTIFGSVWNLREDVPLSSHHRPSRVGRVGSSLDSADESSFRGFNCICFGMPRCPL